MAKNFRLNVKTLSPKQQKLVRLILANIGKRGETMTLKEIMREAGYSEAMAKNPHAAIESEAVQGAIDPYIKELDDKRKLALKYITDKKLKSTSPYSLALINDLLTKNHQLLSGKATGRVDVLDDEEKARIDALFKKNNSKK